MPQQDQTIAGLEALTRLIEIAQKDTGQSRRVADFLLAWHNAAENGGWDVTDLWNVDQSIADDMLKQPVFHWSVIVTDNNLHIWWQQQTCVFILLGFSGCIHVAVGRVENVVHVIH